MEPEEDERNFPSASHLEDPEKLFLKFVSHYESNFGRLAKTRCIFMDKPEIAERCVNKIEELINTDRSKKNIKIQRNFLNFFKISRDQRSFSTFLYPSFSAQLLEKISERYFDSHQHDPSNKDIDLEMAIDYSVRSLLLAIPQQSDSDTTYNSLKLMLDRPWQRSKGFLHYYTLLCDYLNQGCVDAQITLIFSKMRKRTFHLKDDETIFKQFFSIIAPYPEFRSATIRLNKLFVESKASLPVESSNPVSVSPTPQKSKNEGAPEESKTLNTSASPLPLERVIEVYQEFFINDFMNCKNPNQEMITKAAKTLCSTAMFDYEPAKIMLKKLKGSPAYKAAQNGKPCPKKAEKEYKLAQACLELEKEVGKITPPVKTPKKAVIPSGNKQASPISVQSPDPKVSSIPTSGIEKIDLLAFLDSRENSQLTPDEINEVTHMLSRHLSDDPNVHEYCIATIEQMIKNGEPIKDIQKFQGVFLDAVCKDKDKDPYLLKLKLDLKILDRLSERFFHNSQLEVDPLKKSYHLLIALQLTVKNIIAKTLIAKKSNTSLDWDSDLSCKNLLSILEKDKTDGLESYTNCYGMFQPYLMGTDLKDISETILYEVLSRSVKNLEVFAQYICVLEEEGEDTKILTELRRQLDKHKKPIEPQVSQNITIDEPSPLVAPPEKRISALTERTDQGQNQGPISPEEKERRRKAKEEKRERKLQQERAKLQEERKNTPQNFSSPSSTEKFSSLPKTPESLPTPLDPKKEETPPSEKQGIKQKIKKILPLKSSFLKKDKEKAKKKEEMISPTETLVGDGSSRSQETSAKPPIVRTKSLTDLSKPRKNPELNRTHSLLIPNKKKPESTETTSSEGTSEEGKPRLRRSSSKKLPKSPTFGEYKRHESEKKLARRNSKQYLALPSDKDPADVRSRSKEETSSSDPVDVRSGSKEETSSSGNERRPSFSKLQRSLSRSNLDGRSSVKLTPPVISHTLNALQDITWRCQNNVISATKNDDPTVHLTIHTHDTSDTEWFKRPEVVDDFLWFVSQCNAELAQQIREVGQK